MSEVLWRDRKRTLLGMPLSLTSYELTEDRLYIRTGLFTQTEDEVRLYRIMDVTLIRTLRQRLLGLGTIRCSSTDPSQREGGKSMKGDFDLKNIARPKEVRDYLSDLIEEDRLQKRIVYRENLDLTDFDHSDHDDDN